MRMQMLNNCVLDNEFRVCFWLSYRKLLSHSSIFCWLAEVDKSAAKL